MPDAMSCALEYNRAVEFILSLLKYSNYKERQTSWNVPELNRDIAKELMDFSPNVKVKEWLEYVDSHISPFLRNDVLFITNDIYRVIDVCLHLVLMEDLEEPLDLIEALRVLDTRTMVEIAYKFYELEAPLDDDKVLKKAIIEHFSEEVANSFMELKNYPEGFRDKAVTVLESFYEEFYRPYEKTVYEFMEKRLDFHHNLFDKDPVYFINTVGLGDYTKAIELHKEIKLYLSFFIDVGILYFTYYDTLCMYCGQTVEYRFQNKKKQDTYKALFKALSDDKRIEILQLTSERPWYSKELADHFKLSTATLSYHLNLLLDLGVLNFEPSIVNNRYYYTTNKDHIRNLFEDALKGILE